MQDLLTLTLESLATLVTLVMFLDFFSGLRHLYNTSAVVALDKPEEAMLPRESAFGIAFVPLQENPEEITTINDPWLAEVEVVVESFHYYAPVTPERSGVQPLSKTVYPLPPAVLETGLEPEIDYSEWTIRALKKEAQKRKLSKYSSLTKLQLISRLTAT